MDLRLRSGTSCEGGCDVNVSCVTSVLVEYDTSDGRPLLTRCSSVKRKGTGLCEIGAVVPQLPDLPTGGPFRIVFKGFGGSSGQPPDCTATDPVFEATTPDTVDLSGADPPTSIFLEIGACAPARCGGVEGTVYSWSDDETVTEEVRVQFGFIDGMTARFAATSPTVTMAADKQGASFALISDNERAYRDNESSALCRAFRVERGFAPTLSCHEPDAHPELPLLGERVPSMLPADLKALVDSLATFRAEDSLDVLRAGLIVGRVMSSTGSPVPGVKAKKLPGKCDDPIKTDSPNGDCVFYPNDNLVGFRPKAPLGQPATTGNAGLFVVMGRTTSAVDDEIEVEIPGSGARIFLPARVYFIENHVFLAELREGD